MKKCLSLLCLLLFVVAVLSPVFADDSPIHEAAEKGDLAAVKALINANPSLVNSADDDGETPLHAAAEHGHLEVVKFLVSKGANINAKDEKGRTPLYEARKHGHADVVDYLIKQGAKG